MVAVLYVCTTCRAGRPVLDGEDCAGTVLHSAFASADLPDGVVVRPVECLSACDQGCTIALTQSGGWSYIYGGITEADVPDVLRGASLYATSPDGLVPWQQRPQVFRKQGLARLPPTEA